MTDTDKCRRCGKEHHLLYTECCDDDRPLCEPCDLHSGCQSCKFLKEQWADGYISAEELYEKLMAIRRSIDRTIEHALSWEEGCGGDED